MEIRNERENFAITPFEALGQVMRYRYVYDVQCTRLKCFEERGGMYHSVRSEQQCMRCLSTLRTTHTAKHLETKQNNKCSINVRRSNISKNTQITGFQLSLSLKFETKQ